MLIYKATAIAILYCTDHIFTLGAFIFVIAVYFARSASITLEISNYLPQFLTDSHITDDLNKLRLFGQHYLDRSRHGDQRADDHP